MRGLSPSHQNGRYGALRNVCSSIDLEGTEICDWLNSKGITAVLLKYRVPTKPKVGPYSESPQALENARYKYLLTSVLSPRSVHA